MWSYFFNEFAIKSFPMKQVETQMGSGELFQPCKGERRPVLHKFLSKKTFYEASLITYVNIIKTLQHNP